MKKILLSSLMLLLAVFVGSAQNKYDVNSDGSVNAGDVSDLYRYILNPDDEPQPQPGERGLYICNQVGWEQVALYAWPENDVLPGWPGILSSGTVEKYDKTYLKFDLNDNYFGTELNFIANNNDQGQQVDLLTVTLGDEPVYVVVYLSKTGAIAARIDDGSEFEEPDPEEGYKLYVHSELGWDAYAMYVWSSAAGGNVEAGWPGVQPAETVTINGESWIVFNMSKAYSSYSDTNWIINNNGGGVQFDLMQGFNFQADTYVRVAVDGSYTVSNSAN